MAPKSFTAATYIDRFDQLRKGEYGENCCLEILNDVGGDGSHLVSGPCFRQSSQIPTVFARCFPRSGEECLSFQLHSVLDVWTAGSPWFREFPTFDAEFHRWYPRMASQDRIFSLWKKAGIDRALQFSFLDWNLNLGLLGSVICFLSPSSNCFFFPWGPMSITLLDVHVIAGFMPTGVAVNDIGAPRYLKSLKSVNDDVLDYGSFMNTFRRPTGRVDDDEHAAFLLYWLCKHVFFHPMRRVCKHLLGIASSLAEGVSIALGPLILAALYRGIRHAFLAMRRENSGAFSGSFWLLQAWIALYFPFLFSNQNHDLPTYNDLSPQAHVPAFIGCQLLSRLPLPIPEGVSSLTYFLGILFDFDRDKFDFCPFKSESFSYLYRFPSRAKFIDFWVKVLTPVDLPLKFSKKEWFCHWFFHGFEIYSSHYCARQFGLIQGIPMPIYYSLEFPFRPKNYYKWTQNRPFNCCTEITKIMLARFSVNVFSPDPKSTPDYNQWWERCYLRYFVGN